jgi:hypothetical protein
MNGLLAWWGIPGVSEASDMNARVKRTLALVADLNKIYREASSRQCEALSAANEEYVRALQQLLSARRPAEVVSAQSSLLSALVECFATQSRTWAELTQELGECCSAIAREDGNAARERIAPSPPSKSQRQPRQSVADEAAGDCAVA